VRVTDSGMPVQDLIEAVKQAIKVANVSRTTDGRDLQIGSVRLTLHAVATRSYGGGLNFRIPLIGTEVNLGGKLSRQDTHKIEINMVPPAPKVRPELRDSNLGDALVEAIETIRAALVPRPATFARFLASRSEGTWEVERGAEVSPADPLISFRRLPSGNMWPLR